jgi:hypothetical protein
MGTMRFRRQALAVLLCCPLVTAAACRNSVPYPPAARAEFLSACPHEFWPWASAAPATYCTCLLDKLERRWSLEKMNRVRTRILSGGYSSVMSGVVVRYPSGVMDFMAECKTRTEQN